MAYSSKISRRGIAPIDVELSKILYNIKRRVLFTVDQSNSSSSGALSANASAACISRSPSPTNIRNSTQPTTAKKLSTQSIIRAPSKALPPVEILFNPYSKINQPTANASDVDAISPSNQDKPEVEDPFQTLVNRTIEGLRSYAPELCDEGENGTYFLRDKSGKKIAVFKCADEEGISSPKRKTVQSFDEDDEYFKQFHLEINAISDPLSPRSSVNIEQILTDCVKNEVAAYMLDLQANRFYSVPQTGLVAIHPVIRTDSKKKDGNSDFSSTKVGSLQEFIESDGTASDVGPVLFPVKEVHKIGILDLQILNLDRHLGNILIQKCPQSSSSSPTPNRPSSSSGDSPFRNRALSGVPLFSSGQGPSSPSSIPNNILPPNPGTSLPSSWPRSRHTLGEFVLTPIDHGYSLPRSFSAVKDLWFEWITFPQAKRPFDEDTKHFIASINIEENGRFLHELGICQDSIKIMQITTTLLKKCAQANWTLYDIAMLVVNSTIHYCDEPSAMEDLIAEVEEDYASMLTTIAGQTLVPIPEDHGFFLYVVSQKIDDLIGQHQQMQQLQRQFERSSSN
jgi:hypothetical protein